MTKQEAFEKLELENGASQQDIKQQYQEFYNEFLLRITNAPTTHQKTLYQKKLKQLEEAYSVLTGKSIESMDSEIPWSSPGETFLKQNIEHAITKAEPETPNEKQPESSKEKITKTKALSLLGLRESFTDSELETVFEIKKRDCERGIQESGLDAVKQAYITTLQDMIKAYHILVPLAIEEKIEESLLPTETMTPSKREPNFSSSPEEPLKPNGKSIWLYILPILLLAVALYLWEPWKAKFTEKDRNTYTNLKREADSIALVGNVELALEKYERTKEFIETLDPEIANEFTANDAVNDSISVLMEKVEWLNSLPIPIRDLVTSMVYVEGGSFTMGCTSEQKDCNGNEKPNHKVTVNSFNIGKYEVTQAQWNAIMQGNPSWFKDCDLCPVESVTWKSTNRFINKLNEITGWKFRLPTEAEWEYAARGGQLTKGFIYAGSNDLNSVGWYKKNSGNKTHPVGEKKSNELGLYDMSGNVLEWCNDWYGADFYINSPKINPKGPKRPSEDWWWNFKVARGGRWDDISDCRVSFRASDYEGISNLNMLIGFRVVVSN
ncbi:formylglycine-generating enzyme family protein [Tamlana flava]|uniref:formylglycine-generating enzyme family protein n=1 Tax=Tamlana flava TaxID=3158572 RepID=UPI00351B31A2